MTAEGWFNGLIGGVADAVGLKTLRSQLRFLGNGVMVADNESNASTDVTIAGTIGGRPVETPMADLTDGGPLVWSAADQQWEQGAGFSRRTSLDSHHVACWACDEAIGATTAIDSVAGHNLTTVTPPGGGAPPQFGKSGPFSRSVSCTTGGFLVGAPTLVLPGAGFSIDFWLWSTSGGGAGQYIVSKGYQDDWSAGSHCESMAILLNSGTTIQTYYDLGAGEEPGPSLQIQFNALPMWRHIGLTYDGAAFNLYCDGDPGATTSINGSVGFNSVGGWALGNTWNSSKSYPFSGKIADVRFSNIARTADYFAAIAAAGR